ncbi:MAG: LPS export ABC transporter permease LptF [Dissulfuribacterales bacterium]
MKLNSIIDRYIFKELIPPFTMNLVFFIFIFFMQQILEITNMIVNYQVSILAFFLMLIYSMPYFLVFIIPMSVMMSVLLTFLRLSADNEVVALKASGISIYRLLPPVLTFSLMCALITGFLSIYGMPWGENAYKQMALKIVQSNFNLGLKERQFNDSFDGVMFYVNKIDLENKSMKDIYIEDQRKKGISSTVIAPEGYLFNGSDKYSFILRLYKGTVNQIDLDSRSAHSIKFDTYDLKLDIKSAVSHIRKRKKDEKEMQLTELIAFVKTIKTKTPQYYSVLMEIHKKISIPFACFALAILAVPLGVQSLSTRKSSGLGIGLIAFLVYYLLLSAGLVFGEAGLYPPVIGMWMPNIIMGGLGLFLLIKTANDRPIAIFIRMNRLLNTVAQYFGLRGRASE